jgi:putative ATP-dependent endonuclease of OLD family
MYLAELNIENFRGFKSARLVLKRRTLLIGANNVGKTTVLEAAALLLGRYGMVIEPNEWDFFNGWMFAEDVPAPAGSSPLASETHQQEAPSTSDPRGGAGRTQTPVRLRISGVLADLTRDEQRVFCHPSRAGALAAWNPKTETMLTRAAGKDDEPAVRIAYEAQFDAEEGEVVTRRFFPVDGEDPFAGDPSDPLHKKHIQMAGYYLLSATRLWKDAVKFTSAIFGSLLRQRQVHTGEQVRQIARALESLQPKAQDAEELKELLAGLRETLARFIAVAPTDPLGFEVTELSSPDVERALTLFLQGARDDRRFPMSRHGSAAISIQILAMLVMLGRHRKAQGQSFLLGLEEPELHLHPHAQRNLISAVQGEATQLLVTTHSPAITECFKPDEVCVLSTQSGVMTARYLLDHEVTTQTKNTVKTWIFTRRKLFAEALMSPVILLVEGDTEADFLPVLSTLSPGVASLDEIGCTVVPCDGSGLPKVLTMLERFPGTRIVVLDGDQAGTGHLKAIQDLPPSQRPHLVLQLPAGKAIEMALAHGLDDDQAKKVLDEVRQLAAQIGVSTPAATGRVDLERFLVESQPKKSPILRTAISAAYRAAEVVPPLIVEIQKAAAQPPTGGPANMVVRRLGAEVPSA